jgi:hypothetical protein
MFLIVIATSLIAGIMTMAVVGTTSGADLKPGDISSMLINISSHINLVQLSVLGGMLNSTGIVVLAVLLYIILSKQNRNLALVALGLWLAEAIFYAVMQIGSLALIPLSQDFVAAGAPANSSYLVLGTFLFNGVYNQGLAIHMWFYCAGGLLWYYLFYRSLYVPRALSLFGIAAVSLSLVGNVFQIFGYDVPMLVSIPIGMFELAIGVWLLLRGIREEPPVTSGSGRGSRLNC